MKKLNLLLMKKINDHFIKLTNFNSSERRASISIRPLLRAFLGAN
jgi:hypothetical protein